MERKEQAQEPVKNPGTAICAPQIGPVADAEYRASSSDWLSPAMAIWTQEHEAPAHSGR